MKIPIKGLTTVVTGGASGIGLSVSNHILKSGGKLSVIDLKHESDTKYRYDSQSIKNFNHFIGNVIDDDSLSKIWSKELCKLSINSLVNCAGTGRGFNYYASYLVSRHALQAMTKNELNDGACRGCIINVIKQPKDEDEYLNEEKEFNNKIESLDDKVMRLSEDLVAARIRTNTIIMPKGCDYEHFATMVLNVIEDQLIVGEIITLETEEEQMNPF